MLVCVYFVNLHMCILGSTTPRSSESIIRVERTGTGGWLHLTRGQAANMGHTPAGWLNSSGGHLVEGEVPGGIRTLDLPLAGLTLYH